MRIAVLHRHRDPMFLRHRHQLAQRGDLLCPSALQRLVVRQGLQPQARFVQSDQATVVDHDLDAKRPTDLETGDKNILFELEFRVAARNPLRKRQVEPVGRVRRQVQTRPVQDTAHPVQLSAVDPAPDDQIETVERQLNAVETKLFGICQARRQAIDAAIEVPPTGIDRNATNLHVPIPTVPLGILYA